MHINSFNSKKNTYEVSVIIKTYFIDKKLSQREDKNYSSYRIVMVALE